MRVCDQGVFIGALLAGYILLYLPLIKKMDTTIKRSRAMLLLFPAEVVNSVPEIREVMSDYSKAVVMMT